MKYQYVFQNTNVQKIVVENCKGKIIYVVHLLGQSIIF